MYACRCLCHSGQVDPLKLERRPGHLMVISRGEYREGEQLERIEKRPCLELITTICLRGRSSQAFSEQQVLPSDKGRGSQRGQDLKFISPNSTSVLPKDESD